MKDLERNNYTTKLQTKAEVNQTDIEEANLVKESGNNKKKPIINEEHSPSNIVTLNTDHPIENTITEVLISTNSNTMKL